VIIRKSFTDSDFGKGVLAQTRSKKMFGEDRESFENTIYSKKEGVVAEYNKWNKLK
jgi:hypothetical protein